MDVIYARQEGRSREARFGASQKRTRTQGQMKFDGGASCWRCGGCANNAECVQSGKKSACPFSPSNCVFNINE